MSFNIDRLSATLEECSDNDLESYIKSHFVVGFDGHSIYPLDSFTGFCIAFINGILRSIKIDQSGGDERMRKCLSFLIDSGELKITDLNKLDKIRFYAHLSSPFSKF